MKIKKTMKSVYFQPYIQNTFLKLISPIFPEPENSVDSELRYGVWNATSNLFQTTGRQLGEANVHQGYRYRKLPIEYRECKIEGSRSGKDTNLSALQDIMRNYADAMQILSLIRQHYIDSFSLQSQVFDAGTLFSFTQHVVSLPLFMVRDKRNNDYKDSIVDEQVAVLFQLVAGGYKLIRLLLEDHTEQIKSDDIVDATFLYEYSERNNLFATPSAQKHGKEKVCGGSHMKVVELLDFLIRGTEASKSFEPDESALSSRGVNPDAYLIYSLTALQLETTINQGKLESIFCLLSNNNLELIEEEKLILIQIRLNQSNYSETLKGAFSSQQQYKECIKAIEYRLSINQEHIQNLQKLRNSLRQNNESKYFMSPLLSSDYCRDKKLTLYKKIVKQLQQEVLNILGDTRLVKVSDRFLEKRLSV